MIEKLKNEALNVDWKDCDSISNFHENQYLYFNNYKALKEIDDIVDVIQMKAHYINALISKKHYTRGLEIVKHIDYLLKRIEGKSDLFEKLVIENKFYCGILNGNLKNYKISVEAFSQLIEADKNNDLYKDWYYQMKTNLLSERLRIISYVGLSIVFGDIISGLAFSYDFDRRIVLIGFILMLSGWLLPKAINRLIKYKE